MKTNLMKSVLMFMALGAVVFTSCTNNELEIESNDPAAVRFTSAIAAPASMTKAAGATWASGDEVGIFMVDNTTFDIAENAENRLYKTTDASTFTTDEPIYYPQSGNVDFIAYYPHKVGQTLTTDYAVNVATQTSQAAIDLLYSNDAKGKSKGTTAVGLTFYHKLSKVIINIKQPSTIAPNTTGLDDDDLALMTVKIKGMNTAADFNLTTGALGAYSAPAEITALPKTMGSQYEAIVLPAEFAPSALTMDFALNNVPKNEVFTRKNTIIEKFEAGKVYNYNITIKRTGVTFTCEITDWDTAPVRTGDAE